MARGEEAPGYISINKWNKRETILPLTWYAQQRVLSLLASFARSFTPSAPALCGLVCARWKKISIVYITRLNLPTRDLYIQQPTKPPSRIGLCVRDRDPAKEPSGERVRWKKKGVRRETGAREHSNEYAAIVKFQQHMSISMDGMSIVSSLKQSWTTFPPSQLEILILRFHAILPNPTLSSFFIFNIVTGLRYLWIQAQDLGFIASQLEPRDAFFSLLLFKLFRKFHSQKFTQFSRNLPFRNRSQ